MLRHTKGNVSLSQWPTWALLSPLASVAVTLGLCGMSEVFLITTRKLHLLELQQEQLYIQD